MCCLHFPLYVCQHLPWIWASTWSVCNYGRFSCILLNSYLCQPFNHTLNVLSSDTRTRYKHHQVFPLIDEIPHQIPGQTNTNLIMIPGNPKGDLCGVFLYSTPGRPTAFELFILGCTTVSFQTLSINVLNIGAYTRRGIYFLGQFH